MLVLGIQQSDSDTHISNKYTLYVHNIFFFRFFSLIGYYKVLSIVLGYTVGPCWLPVLFYFIFGYIAWLMGS